MQGKVPRKRKCGLFFACEIMEYLAVEYMSSCCLIYWDDLLVIKSQCLFSTVECVCGSGLKDTMYQGDKSDLTFNCQGQ